MTLWPRGYVRSHDKRKATYFFLRKTYSHQTLQGADMCGEAKPTEVAWLFDHMIKRGRVSNWNHNVSSFSFLWPPDLTEWWLMVTGIHPWSHMTPWIRSLGRSREKFKTSYLLFSKAHGPQALQGGDSG